MTLAKLLNHRMGVMILLPHSRAGRTRVRVRALCLSVCFNLSGCLGFQRDPLVAQMVKSLPAMQETRVQSLGWGRSPGEGNGTLLQYSCLGNPMDGGAWQATVRGVTKSRTRLSGSPTSWALTPALLPCGLSLPPLVLIEAE